MEKLVAGIAAPVGTPNCALSTRLAVKPCALRRTAARLRSLTANRVAGRSALVPSMVHSVCRWLGVLRAAAAALGGGQETRELSASRVEGALLCLRLSVREQRATLVVDEIAQHLLDGLFAKVAVHLQSPGDLAAQSPQVVAVPAQVVGNA
jgi:hypothetical protein